MQTSGPISSLPSLLGEALVEQHTHCAAVRSSRFLEKRDRLLAADTGKFVEKFVDGRAAFQRVGEVLHRHARPGKDSRAAEDLGIAHDNGTHGR